MGKVSSFRDLRVYQKLTSLHLQVHQLSLGFPRFETYELGSQLRRSSNAAPAILAEGWGSRHTNIYIESISRAAGELRETQHHLGVAHAKGYLSSELFAELEDGYDHCGRMLERLHRSLSQWRNTTRTGAEVREDGPFYDPVDRDWDQVADLTSGIEEADTQ